MNKILVNNLMVIGKKDGCFSTKIFARLFACKNMRNITAQELVWLEQFMREQGKEGLANSYKSEEEELQTEMNRD